MPATEPFIVVVNGSPLVALGRLCSECGTLSLGDVSHSRAEEFYCVCNHHNVSADRVQILNERHPLISAAVLELDRRAKELIPTIESLPFTAMTPSKDLIKMSEHRNTLSVYRVAKCDKCSHVMAAVNGGQCTNCTADWSGDSGSVIQATPTVRGNLNERLIKTLEKAKVIQSAAWCLQQELFTSEAQLKEIQQNEVSRHFTSYPFAMKDEVVESVKKGLPVVSAVPTNQKDTVATIRSTLELVEKSASTPSSGTVKPPYTPLTYLTMRSGSEPWVQRIQHQQHLVKAVTAAGMRTVLLSSMIGRLVVTDSNQDCTTGYVGASEMMSYIANLGAGTTKECLCDDAPYSTSRSCRRADRSHNKATDRLHRGFDACRNECTDAEIGPGPHSETGSGETGSAVQRREIGNGLLCSIHRICI